MKPAFNAFFQIKAAKWFPLLHCKYGKAKPEIRLALYLDDDKDPQNDRPVKEIPGEIKSVCMLRFTELKLMHLSYFIAISELIMVTNSALN